MSDETEALVAPRDYKAEITDIVRGGMEQGDMREALLDYHANDIAAVLSELDEDGRSRVYRALDVESLANVLEYVSDIGEYLSELDTQRRVQVLSSIEAATAVSYLEELDKSEYNSLVSMMPEEVKKEISLLKSFDKDEIGSKMTTNYISIRQGLGVRGAMSELIVQAAENDNVSTIYVVDAQNTFVGAIDLKDLIRARATLPLEEIIMTSYPYVYADEAVDDCIERLKGYSEDSIPVLDSENKLRGVLTAQDLAEMIEDKIGDDYAKLGGLSGEEDAEEPLFKSIGKRLPWLVILFGLGLIVSSIVGVFDHVVAALPLLVSFQSLILGMAGNVGTQSLAVTIRSLVDEELTGAQKLYLVYKEVRVGVCNGLILGALSFGIIGVYLFAFNGTEASLAFSISFCTGAALFISMLLSSMFGTAIPLIFKKLKIDPAVASGPFITTINDLVAVVTYYGLAWALLVSRLS